MKPRYITDYLSINRSKYKDQTAITFSGKSLNWDELLDKVSALSGFICKQVDTESQKVICLAMPNSLEFVLTYLAIIESGHIAMPIDVIYKPLEISAILNQVNPALFIVDAANDNRLPEKIKRIIYDDIPTDRNEYISLRLPPDEMIASLVFTSGTTGKPKIASYSHSNHIWNIKVCSEVWGWVHSDAYLMSLRLSHWYGLCMGITGWLYHGNQLYLEDTFDARSTLEMLSSGKISIFSHTPIAYAKMLEITEEHDLSSVRLCISGSAALPPQVWEDFKYRFGTEIIETYGSSETGRVAANLLSERIPGSPGIILNGVKIKLAKNNELLVKSPGLFPGYYMNEAATKKSLTSDGYWRTGDIAEVSNERLFLKGRTQETIRRMGYTVSPRDIEWALQKMDGIKECAVVGQNVPGSDDQIVYFVSGPATEREILEYSRTNLPSVWRPNKINFLTKLPRTAAGKVSLAKLKAMI